MANKRLSFTAAKIDDLLSRIKLNDDYVNSIRGIVEEAKEEADEAAGYAAQVETTLESFASSDNPSEAVAAQVAVNTVAIKQARSDIDALALDAEAEVKEISIKEDSSDADLNISDPEGHVLVQFKNGHIKTKNFDSSAKIDVAIASSPSYPDYF